MNKIKSAARGLLQALEGEISEPLEAELIRCLAPVVAAALARPPGDPIRACAMHPGLFVALGKLAGEPELAAAAGDNDFDADNDCDAIEAAIAEREAQLIEDLRRALRGDLPRHDLSAGSPPMRVYEKMMIYAELDRLGYDVGAVTSGEMAEKLVESIDNYAGMIAQRDELKERLEDLQTTLSDQIDDLPVVGAETAAAGFTAAVEEKLREKIDLARLAECRAEDISALEDTIAAQEDEIRKLRAASKASA